MNERTLMKPWDGNVWRESGAVLVLAESWYGKAVTEDSLIEGIEGWIEGETDYLFSRIFNACSGNHASKSSPQDRRSFWSTIAFQNFVCWSIGSRSNSRPTVEAYRQAKPHLDILLASLKPSGVWIIGVGQAEHSEPIVRKRGIVFERVRHPRSGVSNATLKASWDRLQRKVLDLAA